MQMMVAQCARLNDLQTRAPFATSKEQPAPKEPASKPDVIVIPRDSEECVLCVCTHVCARVCSLTYFIIFTQVASGAARPQATSLNDLVSMFGYADQTCNDLYASDAGNNTLVSAEERAAARKASTATLRALLNRVLTVMYTPVAKNGWSLQLEPEPQAVSGEQSVTNVVSLHQAGLLSREEARDLIGEIYGRDLAAST